VKSFGTLLDRSDSIEARKEEITDGGVGTGVDPVLPRTVSITRIWRLQFWLAATFMFGVLYMITGVLGFLLGSEDESVST
jgi:predicted secreted protein